MGIRNQISRLRTRKLDEREALLVAKTDHPSVPDRPSDILVLTIGEVTNVNREGVVCIINLL